MELNQIAMVLSVAALVMSIGGMLFTIASSQKAAEDIDVRLRLYVVTNKTSGDMQVESYPIADQEHAQRLLNEYMFSAIVSAYVFDPIDNKQVATMDNYGRLRSVHG